MRKKNPVEIKPSLENTKSDMIAAIGRSVVGAVPFAGPLLTELVTAIIPNQRIDRLSDYVRLLEEKLESVPRETIAALKKDEIFIDLLEEGFVQASRARSTERREYIANILANGVCDELIALNDSKHLMKLLEELNDTEVIWLRSYLDSTKGSDNIFRERHANTLAPAVAYMGANEETVRKAALQKSYSDHLERLGLIRRNIVMDRKKGIPEFDPFTGHLKVSYPEVTPLGRLLLNQIGLM